MEDNRLGKKKRRALKNVGNAACLALKRTDERQKLER